MKIAMFTDIHWGARSNGLQHNEDCRDYIDWFAEQVRERDCGAIVFMGDWFENRNAINVGTLNASYEGLKILDAIGIPIYFCVGNHDLYHRSSRSLYSTHHYESLKNVVIVNEPMFVGNQAFYPFLFKEEYANAAAQLVKHAPKYVFGHFEFRNFVITGSDRRMEHGPEHSMFNGPKYIFSGHYHKRQALDNIVYIGNTFPTNYGDAWDDARGAAILDTDTDDVDFIDWTAGPKFRKVRLSDVLTDANLFFPPKCRVKCVIDVDVAYSEVQILREELIKQLSLREFSLEENINEKKDALEGEELTDNFDFSCLNDAVIKMLQSGISNTSTIDAARIIELYTQL